MILDFGLRILDWTRIAAVMIPIRTPQSKIRNPQSKIETPPPGEVEVQMAPNGWGGNLPRSG
jgi:hypothetical protein